MARMHNCIQQGSVRPELEYEYIFVRVSSYVAKSQIIIIIF